jgi:2-polyprenyl-3-methyl-5-hydroxy-6-metoxy-1,4-benzoquinol methylase
VRASDRYLTPSRLTIAVKNQSTAAGSDAKQALQEAEYAFPYHYIPRYESEKFRSFIHWPWSFRYLGGIKLVCDLLSESPFTSLLDVGCGDGRLINEIRKWYPDASLNGLDASEQAIAIAKALTQNASFMVRDIIAEPLHQVADVVTLIEVLEHIPPRVCEEFIAAAARAIKPGGRLILTVPHINKPVEKKHFRHFSKEDLLSLFRPHLSDLRFVAFDRLSSSSVELRLIEKIIGGRGRFFLIANQRLLGALYRRYLFRYLYCVSEKTCGRIAVVGRRRTA